MNSRDNMIRAIQFQTPERLPVQYDAFGITDICGVGLKQIGTGDPSKREALDEWGCLWVRSELKNMGQVKGHPLREWADLDHYRWPDPDDRQLYDGIETGFQNTGGKYVLTGMFMLLFERMHSLRGFENVLTDFYLEREKVEQLADRIVEYDLAVIKNISARFPNQIDGFAFTDDWGTEKALFISPTLWDEFFKPRYQRIFAACKAAEWHVWMHSCGKINAIIPGLIDIGLDVLNVEQPRILDIEETGRKFAGKLCFSSGCDIQHTLPFKGEAEIREEAELLMNCWGTEKGGFILSDDGNDVALGIPREKKPAALQAFLELDPWKKQRGTKHT